MPEPTVEIHVATLADAETILAVQKAAYQSEARIYGDWQIPPLTQTVREMERDIERLVVLKAVLDGDVVGSVRAGLLEGTCHIGRLVVRPDVEGRGIGSRLLREIEARFPTAARFELFTGHRSERNLGLYQRRGYRIFKTEPASPGLTLVHLEKART
jgi:ribosomal protein S18 acetylase RimI-like enzyme